MPGLYLYFPFANWEEDQILKNDLSGFRRLGLVCNFADRSTVNCLVPVQDDDLLVIAGHGSLGSGEISMVGASGRVRLTANSLAGLLAADGLSRTHQSILLITCSAGGKSNLATSDGTQALTAAETTGLSQEEASIRVAAKNLEIVNNKAGECLASILGKALGMERYYSILVGGWPGLFNFAEAPSGKVAAMFNIGHRNQTPVLAQLDHIQWYNANGIRQ